MKENGSLKETRKSAPDVQERSRRVFRPGQSVVADQDAGRGAEEQSLVRSHRFLPAMAHLNNLEDGTSFRGAIEIVNRDYVTGWCLDPLRSGKPVSLELRYGEAVVAEGMTGLPRQDIATALSRDCSPGFVFKLRALPPARAAALLELVARHAVRAPSEPAPLQVTVSRSDTELMRWSNGTFALTNAQFLDLLKLSVQRSGGTTGGRALMDALPIPPARSSADESDDEDVKLIAFYLPQFHPVPENDEWWGSGFTEWTNVTSARPWFSGHNQPRVPADMGYYDLRLAEVREKQATLAREYGIHGFCYHFYWFSGRRILERPLEAMLESGSPNFPFCLCWANESWSRRWDGSESEVLLAQDHDLETDLALIDELIPIFSDPRYIRVHGKPFVIIYRVSLLPNPRELFDGWREACRKRGVEPPHICMAESFGLSNPYQYGCDSAVQFPPHKVTSHLIQGEVEGLDPSFTGQIYDYKTVVQNDLQEIQPAYPRFRTIMPSWDNTARKGPSGNVFHGATPELYEVWLRGVIKDTALRRKAGERLVFINAWNEWGEGAYLEPDRRNGRAYLEATRRGASDLTSWRQVLDGAILRGSLDGDALQTFATSLERRFEALERANAFMRSRLDHRAAIWDSAVATTQVPPALREKPTIEIVRGAVDRVNNHPNSSHYVATRANHVLIAGWAAAPGQVLTSETLTYLTLHSSSSDHVWYIPVYRRTQRRDVPEFLSLGEEEGLWSGFEIWTDLRHVPAGNYYVGFGFPHRAAVLRGFSWSILTLE